MEFNDFIFPAPTAGYTCESLEGRLIFVPRAPIVKGVSDFGTPFKSGHEAAPIPCLYIKCKQGSSKLLLYIHANAEDIGIAEDVLEYLSEELNVHVVAPEYPGYGIYPGHPDAPRVTQDAINVYDYIVSQCHWGEENIMVFGRSIGTGPAIQLAALKKPCLLFLLSPFTSIKGVVRSASAWFFQLLVKERFQNLRIIRHVRCPICIVHGHKDKLIPCSHAEGLWAACDPGQCQLNIPENMDHNDIDLKEHVSDKFAAFMSLHHIDTRVHSASHAYISFPDFLFARPHKFPPMTRLGLLVQFLRKIM